MEIQERYITPPGQCPYLSDQQWQLEYVSFQQLSAADYLQLLNAGWRRSGFSAFRPICKSCRACQSLRIPVAQFQPNRSQRRVYKTNAERVALEIGEPFCTEEKLNLYIRHHEHHKEQKAWHGATELEGLMHLSSLMENPFDVEEWCFYLDGRLVACAYIDPLPDGLSGVYFFLDPDLRQYSLGTWIILTMIERCRQIHLPYVYLGYYVQGCRSMAYKDQFKPNQILGPDLTWQDHCV